jgi:hypothetical protein
MEAALEDLCTVEDVSVTRNTVARGHTWLITFTSMKYSGNLQTRHDSSDKHQTLDSHRLSVNGDHLLMCDTEDVTSTKTAADRSECYRSKLSANENTLYPTIDVATRREVQSFVCTADPGFTLTFMGKTTATILATATPLDVENALELLLTVGDVSVTFTDGQLEACNAANKVTVTFESELGDLPAMVGASTSSTGSVVVSESTAGRTQPVVGHLSFSTIISESLVATPDIDWFVRVSAFNSVGYGTYASTMPAKAEPAVNVPTIPRNVAATVGSSTSLVVSWDTPVTNGGSSLTQYEVQWDTVNSFTSHCGERAEVQTVRFTDITIPLNFKLAFTDAAGNSIGSTDCTTSPIAHTATETQIKDAILDQLDANYDGITVSKCDEQEGGVTNGYTFDITFSAKGNVPLAVGLVTPTVCGSGSATVTAEVTRRESLTDRDPLTGTGRDALQCSASLAEPLGIMTTTETDAVNHATSLTLKTATRTTARAYTIKHLTPGIKYWVRVTAINNIGRSPVSHSSATTVAIPAAVPDVPTLGTLTTNTEASLRVQYAPPANVKREGSNGKKVTAYSVELAHRVYEEQKIVVKATGGPITSGSFKIKVENNGATLLTTCLAWNVDPAAMQLALNQLVNVDGVSVSRSTYSATESPNGYGYTVVFDGPRLCNGDIADIDVVYNDGSCTSDFSTVNGESVTTAKSVEGVAGFVPEIVTVTTAADDRVSGSFDLSVDYNGDFTKELCASCGTVKAGSKILKTNNNDLTGVINRGDKIKVGDEIFKVDMFADFTCDEVPLDSYHIGGEVNADVFTEDTAVGHVEWDGADIVSGTVANPVDYQNKLQEGDFVRVGPEDFGQEFLIKSITNQKIILGRADDKNCHPNFFSAAACASDSYTLAKTSTKNPTTLYMRKKIAVRSDIDSYNLKRELETKLPGVGTVDVTRSGPDNNNGFVWTLTFTSHNGPFLCPSYTAGGTNGKVAASPCLVSQTDNAGSQLLSGTSGTVYTGYALARTNGMLENAVVQLGIAPSWSSIAKTGLVQDGVDEVQTITTSADSDNLDGTFTVTFDDGSTKPDSDAATVGSLTNVEPNSLGTGTVSFEHDVTAEDMKKKFERDLPTMGIVEVTRQADLAGYGYIWTVRFITNFGDLPEMVVTYATLSGTNAKVTVAEITKGVPPTPEYVAEGLTNGVAYSARVVAHNELGKGAYTTDVVQNAGEGILPLQKVVRQPPVAPVISSAKAISDSQIQVAFSPPASRGSDIHTYRLEWSKAANFGDSEVKTITLTNTIDADTDGYFTLVYAGQETIRLNHDCNAATMQAALNSLPNMGSVEVARSEISTTNRYGYSWTVTYTQDIGALASYNRPGQANDYTNALHAVITPARTITAAASGSAQFTFSDTEGITAGDKFVIVGDYIPSKEYTVASVSGLVVTMTETWGNSITAPDVASSVPACKAIGTTVTKTSFGASSTTSIKETGTIIAAVDDTTAGTTQTDYGWVDLQTSADCGSHVVGKPSSVQIVRLITDHAALLDAGGFRLELDGMKTSCIAPNADAKTVADALEAIANVVSERVTSDRIVSVETVATRTVGFKHDYRISFWGKYAKSPNNAATDYWPTLNFVEVDDGCASPSEMGYTGTAPSHYALVHSLKVEGPCARGNNEVQVIVAEAEGVIGGSFTVTFNGQRTEAISVDSTAAQMKAVLEKWFAGTEVEVTLSNHRNQYSKAWAVTFSSSGPQDRMRVNDDFVTGTDATVAVYDMVTVTTSADGGMTDGNLQFANIQGEFTLQMGTEISRPLRHDVTHAKVVQELERLNGFGKVEFFGSETGRTALHETVSVSKYVTAATNDGANKVVSFSDVDGVAPGDKVTIEGTEYEVQSISNKDVTLTTPFAGTTVTGKTEQTGQRIFSNKITAGSTTAPTDLTTAVAETNGDKLGDTVVIPALDSFVLTATSGQNNIHVPKGIVPSAVADDVFMIGGQKMKVTVINTANADYDVWSVQYTLDGSFYNGADVLQGNPIVKITGLEYVVNSISYDATLGKSILTLDRAYESSAPGPLGTADNTETAAFGHLVYSKKALPGCLTLVSIMHVEAATTGSTDVTFSDVTGVAQGNKFTIAGQEFEVSSVATTTKIVTMLQKYNGISIVSSSPATKIYGNSITTSADLRSVLDVDAAALGKMRTLKIWLGLDEFTIAANADISTNAITVSGPVTTDYVCSTGLYWANGYDREIVLKSVLGDVNTFRAIPEANWRGTNARLQVARPEGVAPYTYVLGTPSEVQTVALRDTGNGDHGTGTWKLTLGAQTTGSLSYAATTDQVKDELEELVLVDKVTVERNGDGSALSLYGYSYTIVFWGESAYANIPQMTSSTTGLTTATLVHNTVREGTAAAHYLQNILALAENSEYHVRIAAANEEGFGPASAAVSASTADVGVIPGAPRAVSLGDMYTANSLSLYWDAPSHDGGSEITKYRVEWDSSPGFDSSSPQYGESTVSLVHEVQHVIVSFRSLDDVTTRSGSFTLSWGGRETPDLPWNIDETTMAERLQDLTGTTVVGQNPIEVTRVSYGRGYRWAVTFRGIKGNIGQMEADYHMLVGDKPHVEVIEVTPGSADLTPGDYTMEVQTIRTEALSGLGGTFKITFENRQTADIAFDAPAMPQDGGAVGESMKEKLEALTTIHSVNVVKETFDDTFGMVAWTVTFTHVVHELQQGAGNIGLFLPDFTALTGNSAKVVVAEAVRGTDQMNFVIGNLITGSMYYARVTAYNSRGNGPLSAVSSAMPRTQPGAPTSPTFTVASATSLQLSWNAPQSDGGEAVDKYRVEWYTALGTAEKQTITTSAEAHVKEVQTVRVAAADDNLGGYFKLSFKGETTDNIAFNAPAIGPKSMKEKLERLSTVGTVSVTRDYSKILITNFYVDASQCTDVSGGNKCVLNGCQDGAGSTINCNTVLSDGDLLWVASGQYRVLVGGQDSTEITLATVDDGTGATKTTFPDESASKLKVFKWANGYEWTIEFTSHVGDQPELVPSTSNNWAGTLPTLKVQTTRQGLQPISGHFRVSMAAQTTPPLQHDISAENMAQALQQLTTIGTVSVERSVNNYGFNWLVMFTSDLGDLPEMTADGAGLTGPSAYVYVSQTLQGVNPAGLQHVELHTTSYTIGSATPLLTGTAYFARVTAYAKGEGYGAVAFSAPVTETPREAPGVPKSIELMTLTGQSLKVVWSAPDSNGGATIDKYKIEWDTDTHFTYSHELDVSQLTAPFFYNIPISIKSAHLPRFVRVSAHNNVGYGSPGASTPASLAPKVGLPGPAQSLMLTVLSSTTLRLNWAAPNPNLNVYGGDGGSPITQYLIEWDTSKDFDSPSANSVVTGADTHSYTIGGNDVITGVKSTVLQPATKYYARISAFNAQGSGPVAPAQSETALEATTADQLPDAAIAHGTTVVLDDSLSVQFSHPVNDGGLSLSAYTIEWDTQSDYASGGAASAEIPIVHEIQSLAAESTVDNEEQHIIATVEVINERQTVRTVVDGVDEVQTIKTHTSDDNGNSEQAVRPEIATITTQATDRNEVQEIRMTANDLPNEKQYVYTDCATVYEVQEVTVWAPRQNELNTGSVADRGFDMRKTLDGVNVATNGEVQEITITFPQSPSNAVAPQHDFDAMTAGCNPAGTDTGHCVMGVAGVPNFNGYVLKFDTHSGAPNKPAGTSGCHWCKTKTSTGTTTGSIQLWDNSGAISNDNLKNALEALTSVGTSPANQILVSHTTTDTEVKFRVTFQGENVAGNVPDLVLVPGAPIRTASANVAYGEASSIAINTDFRRGNEPTGEFVLHYDCEDYSEPTNYGSAHPGVSADCNAIALRPTSLLANDISMSDLETKLQAVPTIGDVDVTVTPLSPSDSAPVLLKDLDPSGAATDISPIIGYTWTITFKSNHGNLKTLKCDRGEKWGGGDDAHMGTTLVGSGAHGATDTASLAAYTGCSVYTRTQGSMLESGTFRIVDGATGISAGPSTQDLSLDISAADLKTHLESVILRLNEPTTVVQSASPMADWPKADGATDKLHGTVIVTRTANPPVGKWSGGWRWEIEWTNRLGNVKPLIVDDTLKSTVESDTQAGTQTASGYYVYTGCGKSQCAYQEDLQEGNEIGTWDWGCMALCAATKTGCDGGNPDQECYAETSNTGFVLNFKGDSGRFLPFYPATTAGLPQYPSTELADNNFEKKFNTYFAGAGLDYVDVTRSGPTKAMGFTWTVTFTAKEFGEDQPPITLGTSDIAGEGVGIDFYEHTKGNQLLGSFQLTFNGYTSSEIAFDAPAEDMAAKLNALESIRPSRVKVSRMEQTSEMLDYTTNQVNGFTWTITFTSHGWFNPTMHTGAYETNNWEGPAATWADVWEPQDAHGIAYSKAWGKNVGDVDAIDCVTTSLYTSAGTNTEKCVYNLAGEEYASRTGGWRVGYGPLAGTFTVTLDSSSCSSDPAAVLAADYPNLCRIGKQAKLTSGPIRHNAFATADESGGDGTSVEEILEAMTNIGDVSVSRSIVNEQNGGYEWTITFLRDDPETCEEKDDEKKLCNSPGNVPLVEVLADGSCTTGSPQVYDPTTGTTRTVVAADCTLVPTCTDNTDTACSMAEVQSFGDETSVAILDKPAWAFSTVVKRGNVLRGVWETFRVTGDDSNANYCVPSHDDYITGCEAPVSWNAGTTEVKAKLEAQVPGRTVEVSREVIGKYGVVEWVVTFTKNPGQTPPGTGNIGAIQVQVDQNLPLAAKANPSCFPNCGHLDDTQITETQQGSAGLGGVFTVDYESPGGPRTVSFQETASRLELKLDEMTTIADVNVNREMYPSSSTGGWGEQFVADGTRGGYIWKVRFLRNTGTYAGMTFPPGAGNADALALNTAGMSGDGMDVTVKVIQEGSTPMSGEFTVGLLGKTSKSLAHNIDNIVLKQEIEDINAVGGVSCTREDRTGLKLSDNRPGGNGLNAIATVARDSEVATISNADLRRYLTEGDVIRIGGADVTAGKIGSNGDVPVSVDGVSTQPGSPIFPTVGDLGGQLSANPGLGATVVADQQLRLDGDVYDVKRTGAEKQTLTITKTSGSPAATCTSCSHYKLRFLHNGAEATTTCQSFHQTASGLQNALNGLENVGTDDILVTRKSATNGYVFKIYFEGVGVVGDVNELEVLYTADCDTKPTDLTVIPATVKQGGHVEVQQVTLAVDTGSVQKVNYYKLKYSKIKHADVPPSIETKTTNCLQWGATAAEMKTELIGLDHDAGTNGEIDDIIVTREGTGSSVTEIQTLTLTADSTVVDSGSGGNYRLRWVHDGTEQLTSTCLNYHSTAAQIQTALEGMVDAAATAVNRDLDGNTNDITVSRTGTGLPMEGYGYVYTFEFKGPYTGGTSSVLGNVNQLEIVWQGAGGGCNDVTGGLPSYVIKTTRQGSPSYTYTIYFTGDLLGDQMTLTIEDEDDGTCASSGAHDNGSVRDVKVTTLTEGGSSEVQTLTLAATTKPANDNNGFFKLSLESFGIAKKVALTPHVSTVFKTTETGGEKPFVDRQTVFLGHCYCRSWTRRW